MIPRTASEHDRHVRDTLARFQSMTSPAPVLPSRRPVSGAVTWPILCAIGAWAIFILIGAAVFWLLASIHQTTERACPTMDAACQIEQESPQ